MPQHEENSRQGRGHNDGSSGDRRRRRSRSPHHDHRRRRSASPRRRKVPAAPPAAPASRVPKVLPCNARELGKRDYTTYEPMFALYLDIQKELVLEDMEEREAKGRWKRFVSRWNNGELAEGWYDPSTLKKAVEGMPEPTQEPPLKRRRPSPNYEDVTARQDQPRGPPGMDHTRLSGESEEDEDELGPALPNSMSMKRSGPSIPSLHDLELKRELDTEDAENARDELQQQRRANRRTEKERLDELQPREQAGTKERQMEKRKELAASNRAFAAGKTEGGGLAELPDKDLLGGAEDDLTSFKQQKKEHERKKNEREVRRDEIFRARREEREERQRDFRAREERTMQGLIELAKKRFG